MYPLPKLLNSHARASFRFVFGCFLFFPSVVSTRDVGSPGALPEELRDVAGSDRNLAVRLQHHWREGVRRDVLLLQVR